MALVDGDGISGIRFHDGHLGQFGPPASEAGGRAFESRPGHHLVSRTYATRHCERCASEHRTRPNQFPLPYLRHGLDVLGGFMPLSIWARYFRLGQVSSVRSSSLVTRPTVVLRENKLPIDNHGIDAANVLDVFHGVALEKQ